ncbi:ubiquinol-cytochrome C chaperone family protein [Methylopila henanensis]|uniref:Ubiquinol-cytochrome C chaperone family protein n=1 Tax=Methylopila henanensis TaxID=873516 RepID=A0ABW4K2U4_9HYPH
MAATVGTTMAFGLFGRRARPDAAAADAIYAVIVAQARRPALYRDLGAPDTVVGRFEVILLHAVLFFRRVKASPDAAGRAQLVFDAMVRDLDASLREIGVGDMTVPKRMKTMVGAFYARIEAYEAALDRDDDALGAALARHVYGEPAAADRAEAERFAAYVRRADAALSTQPLADLLAAGPAFPEVEETA